MVAGSKARVLVMDAHPFSRQGIISYLDASGIFEVVAEAADGYAAMLAAASSNPALIIMETTKTGMTAYEMVRRLRKLDESVRMLVCYQVEDPVELHELLQAGVSGLMQKNAEPEELMNAARAIMGGGTYLSRSLISRVFPASAGSAHAGNLYGLTAREVEILRYVAEGFSNKEAAIRLNLSVRTVETHRLNIRRKTNAHSLSALVRAARRLHLIRGQDGDDADDDAESQPGSSDVAQADRPLEVGNWVGTREGRGIR